MKSSGKRILVGWIAAWVVAMCVSPPDARATLLFTPADPSLTGATVVPFDANLGWTPGQMIHTTVQNGVTITLSTTSAPGLYDGSPLLATYWPDGVMIDFAPAVGAVGFNYLGAECVGQALFDGAAADETFVFPFGTRDLFIGAANIGDISSVHLNGACFAAWWSDMHFVPSSGPPPTDEADLGMGKRALGPYTDLATTSFELTVFNTGPDTATGVQAVDFLPQLSTLASSSVPAAIVAGTNVNPIAILPLANLVSGGNHTPTVEILPPPFGNGTYCGSALVNFALATGSSLDLNNANNDWTSVVRFDSTSRQGLPEICTNAYDDDCDGRPDCSDSECAGHVRCLPPTPPPPPSPICWGGLTHLPGIGVIDSCGSIVGRPSPSDLPHSGNVRCDFPTRCSGVTLSMALECCEPPPSDTLEWLATVNSCVQDAFAQLSNTPPECQIGREDVGGLSWMGMPVDPNYKEANPPVNIFGHGITSAGRQMTYTLHYENIGTADAHDVLVLDALPLDLDDLTLVINDGGTYDPATRVLRWLDPVLPPNTPRSVSFLVDVRGDAPLGTRIRNSGTIIFPDAVPPSRIDTNFVEHVIPLPTEVPVVDPSILGCTQTGPGSWRVRLANAGAGFGYDATVRIIGGPPTVVITDDTAGFSHPSDLDPSTRSTLAPASYTDSDDVVTLTTPAPGDPCLTLTWRITWQNGLRETLTRDVQPEPDADADGVPDAVDVCPQVADPAQVDTDSDGAGDACDLCPDDPLYTGPCPTPTATPSPTPTATPGPTQTPAPTGEICGNCLDDDGDGKADVADEECSGVPLEIRRGVIKQPIRDDRDRIVIRGSFDEPETAFDPIAVGASVSLFEGDRLVACYAMPPGEGWKTNRRATRWVFRDARDDGHADPDANERLRLRKRRGRIRVDARIKEIEIDAPSGGELTAAVTVGAHVTEATQTWRRLPTGRRLVTP